MKVSLKAFFFVAIAICLNTPNQLLAQVDPALRVETIQMVPGGPLEFTFRDGGTGATAYQVEYSPDLGVTVPWAHDTSAIIADLGHGAYRVTIPGPAGAKGFFRVVGFGPSGDVVVEFSTTAFQITEGDTGDLVITFSAPFTGTLRYSISGTATTADFGTLTGEIHVINSATATLPIAVADNETIDPLRVLILTLEAADGVRAGLSSRVVITIVDRDARWEGTFFSEKGNASLPFSLEIIRTGETTQARLVGGPYHFFPAGPFHGTITAHTASEFSASFEDITLPSESTLLGLPAVLALSLEAEGAGEIGEHFIHGLATLVTTYPGHPHLTITNEGAFLMQRVPPPSSEREVELTPAP
jgi:hypothetical protein